MSMTKRDIVNKVSDKLNISQKAALEAVDSVFDVMREELSSQDTSTTVTVRGFGVFKVVKSAKRSGRNLQTGERVEIPSKFRIKFSSYMGTEDEK